jgi:hemerythrin-like domain-containing protein
MLQLLKLFADDLHQEKEEKVLFPVFTASCQPSEIASIRHMLFEHERDRSLIEGIEDAVRQSHAEDFAQHATRLADTLRNHIYKEDNILFEIIEKTLSAKEDDDVVAGFETLDEEFSERGGTGCWIVCGTWNGNT